MADKRCKNCGFLDTLETMSIYGGQLEVDQSCEKCGSRSYIKLDDESDKEVLQNFITNLKQEMSDIEVAELGRGRTLHSIIDEVYADYKGA